MSVSTTRLFRLKSRGMAIYMSADGWYQFAVREDYPNFEKLPDFLDFTLRFLELHQDSVDFLDGISSRWAAGEQA